MKNCNFENNTAGDLGGGIYWNANNNIIISCIFINNTAVNRGGGICWSGNNGTIMSSTFINNTVINYGGGGICFPSSNNGNIINSIFIGNTADHGGGIHTWGTNITLTSSTFTNNSANTGGGFSCGSDNCIIRYSTFTGNIAHRSGGGIQIYAKNNRIYDSSFTSNSANQGAGIYIDRSTTNNTLSTLFFTDNIAKSYGGAIICFATCSMVNCSFINSKSQQFNGIYNTQNLNIGGGSGIVHIFTDSSVGTLSGISIVVLNNETYYYPPNTNINLTNKKEK